MTDLVLALRGLRRDRAFAVAAVLTLAGALSATTSVFALINAVLLRPLPFHEPDRLVWVWSTRTDRDQAFFSIPNFVDFRNELSSVSGFAGLAGWGVTLTGSGAPERLLSLKVTANLFELMGVTPALGRTLQAADGEAGGQRVVVLGHAVWSGRFGADPDVLGRTLILDGEAYAVVGVLPPGFVLPNMEFDLVLPLSLEADPRRAARGTNFLRVIARLRAGVSAEEAQAEMAALTARLREQFPVENAKHTPPRVVRLRDELSGPYRTGLLLLFGAIALVLVMVCFNLGVLHAVRADGRRGERAIQAALGASRTRLVRQSLLESGVLVLAGAVLGTILAAALAGSLRRLLAVTLPFVGEASLDIRVAAFSVASAFGALLASGVLPAVLAGHLDPLAELRFAGGRTAPEGRRWRTLLVAGQVALSVLLLSGTGLALRSFVRLMAVQPGFEPDRLSLVRLSLPRTRYATPDRLDAFRREVSQRILVVPGVQAVALAHVLPLTGANVRTDFEVEGRPPATAAEAPGAQSRFVSPGYFETVGIPVIQGRGFDERDAPGGRPVVVVDQALARRFFGGEDPIGQALLMNDRQPPRRAEVVGVVGNVKHFGLDEEPLATLYTPLGQAHQPIFDFILGGASLVVRSDVAPASTLQGVRAAIASVDPDLPTTAARTMEDVLHALLAPRRLSFWILTLFGGAALGLALAGVYGSVSQALRQRRREVAIRLALGARGRDVVAMLTAQGFSPVLAGAGLGVVATLAGGPFLERTTLLFATTPRDLATLIVTPALVALLSAVIATLVARRAARVAPLQALRGD